MTYLVHPLPTPGDSTDISAIAVSAGAVRGTFLGERHGKNVVIGEHSDGCRTAILVMDNGDGTVRAWPETDLGRVDWTASTDRHGQRWFIDQADLDTLGSGCDLHASAHWRREHLHAAPAQVLAA